MPDHYCYKNAPDWAQDHPEGNPLVVHGEVVGGPQKKVMGHAWVEVNGDVADPTLGVRMKKEDYYRIFDAKPSAKYTWNQAAINMMRNRHYGPWSQEEEGKHVTERIDTADKPERVTQAAIALPEHTVTGFSHTHAREIAVENGFATQKEADDADEGFVTSRGRFVDRKEALAIAEKARQIAKKPKGSVLVSEDLRWDAVRQMFYRPDQARDEKGKFEDEGKSIAGDTNEGGGQGHPKAGEITVAGVAASIKEAREERENAPKPDPVLSKAIGIWTKPYAEIPDVSEGEVLDSKSIRAIRDAARQIKGGKDVKGEYGDMAKAMLSHSEVIPRSMMRGTSSAYFAKWDAKPEEVLSKFPIGEDVDLTLFSFTQNLSWPHAWDAPKVPWMFANWAQDRRGGHKMFITLEKGAEGVQVERFLETGENNPESEVITTGHATVKSARFNKKKQQFEITLGNK